MTTRKHIAIYVYNRRRLGFIVIKLAQIIQTSLKVYCSGTLKCTVFLYFCFVFAKYIYTSFGHMIAIFYKDTVS